MNFVYVIVGFVWVMEIAKWTLIVGVTSAIGIAAIRKFRS